MDIKHVSGSDGIVAVRYDQDAMEMLVQTNEGTFIFCGVHMGQYRAFESSGFSEKYYRSEVCCSFAHHKA